MKKKLKLAETDTQLMRKIALHDEAAFTELHRRHRGKVEGVVNSVFKGDVVTDDVTQDTWIRVWNKADTFEGKCAVSSWLYRVAMNQALMEWRRRARRKDTYTVEDCAKNKEAPGYDADNVIDARKRFKNMVLLTAAHKRKKDLYPVLSCLCQEMTNLEGAFASGITVAAYKSRTHRVRKTVGRLACG